MQNVDYFKRKNVRFQKTSKFASGCPFGLYAFNPFSMHLNSSVLRITPKGKSPRTTEVGQ